MKLFDTHVHFDGIEKSHRDVLTNAAEAGVLCMTAVGGSTEANAFAQKIAAENPGTVYASAGYDRDQAGLVQPEDAAKALRARFDGDCPPVAVGEIGLDYHYRAESAEAQVDLLSAQLTVARDVCSPVIIHTREAEADTISLLTAHSEQWQGDPGRIGVIHCFSGTPDYAGHLAELGFFISFSGILTFKNADEVRDAMRIVPDEQLLIETDSPLLSPVPLRGKPNEPANVVHVLQKAAEVRGIDTERMAEITFLNACRLFGVSRQSGE